MKGFRAIAILLCLLLPLQAVASLALTGCVDAISMSQETAAPADTGMDCHASADAVTTQVAKHDCCSDTEMPSSEECSHCELCLQSASAAMVARLLPLSDGPAHNVQTPALRVMLAKFPFSLLRPPQAASRTI